MSLSSRGQDKRVRSEICLSLPRTHTPLWKSIKNGAKEGGKEKTSASLLPPSHGPLRLVNSHSRFALSHEVPEEERCLSFDHFVQMDSSLFLAGSARKPMRVFGSITSQLENLFFSSYPFT